MYTPHLNIALVALPEITEMLLCAISSPERVSPAVLSDFTSAADGYNVIIMSSGADLNPTEVRERYPQARIYLATDDEASLSDGDLAVLREVWPLTQTDEMWAFRLQHAIESYWEKKESYYFHTALDTMINSLPDLIWFKDVKGAHLKVNDAFCSFVGKPKDDIEGRGHYYIWGLTEEMYKQGEYVCLESDEEVLRRGVTCHFDEHVDNADGTRNLSTYKTPIRDEDGTILGTVGVAQDVTVELAQRKRIEELAYSDVLTGLGNRYAFYSLIAAQRGSSRVTLLHLDIDNFRLVNDCFGHQKADEALLLFAGFLKYVFKDDICVRLGGDEFIVAIIGDMPLDTVTHRLDNLFSQVRRSYAADRSYDFLSISCGIAWTDNPSESIDELVRLSGMALSIVKRRDSCRITATPSLDYGPMALNEQRGKAKSAYMTYEEAEDVIDDEE